MTVEENIALVKESYEAVNRNDWDAAMELHSGDHLRIGPEGRMEGLDAYREYVEGSVGPFPDLHVDVVNIFGEGDMVCDEHVTTGTHTAPMKTPDGKEIPPTREKFRVHACHIFRIEDGKIAETRVYHDRMSMMAQLGLGQ